MAQNNGEWLQCIARRAKVEIPAVEPVLAAHHIHPAPVLAPARRILLVEIAFSGIKDGVVDDGPFEFVWSNLGPGLRAMLTDENLRGKSSIIEVVRWLLRGRPSDNLQEDVRRWIHSARLRFSIDDVPYEVEVTSRGAVAGKLVRLGLDGGYPTPLASFRTDREFEEAMADFFMRQLGMEAITSWRDTTDAEEAGQAVLHGWVAFSGAMFIGTNYEVLLGEMPVTAGLNPRLIQMYVGLPWVSTLASAKTAQQAVQNAAERRSRLAARAVERRRGRIAQIEAELAARRAELAELPSDQETRRAVSRLSSQYGAAKRKELVLEQRLAREASARSQAESEYQDDRRQLQSHLDAMAAGAIFRALDPVCCPRCDHEVGSAKKAQEKETHACSVCGETIVTNDDAELMKAELETRARASKAAYEKSLANHGATVLELRNLQADIENTQSDLEKQTELLGNFELRQQLQSEISTLEGRRAEASAEPDRGSESSEPELAILNAVIAETESRVKDLREDVFSDISARLVQYARRFGMHNLSEGVLRANATLSLTKGGVVTSYSKVTEGEKLRLKVAAVLAIIEAAEKRGLGRHPGLLMIDSPAAQEVSPHDVAELVAGLRSVTKEISHLQVFVAGVTSPAITANVPTANRREAVDGGFLW